MPSRDRPYLFARARLVARTGAASLLGIALLTTAISSSSQQLDASDGTFVQVKTGGRWIVPDQFGSGSTLAVIVVSGNPERLVVAQEVRDPRTQRLPTRTLSFYERRGGDFIETHRLATPNTFVGMYPTLKHDRLITTWESGSAGRTGVFALGPNDVRLVLWLGLKWPPEFAFRDGEDTVVAPIPTFPAPNIPTEAQIYRWTGKDYVLARTVPWARRHEPK